MKILIKVILPNNKEILFGTLYYQIPKELLKYIIRKYENHIIILGDNNYV